MKRESKPVQMKTT